MRTFQKRWTISKLKKIFIKGLNYFNLHIKINFESNLWLSLGENCLTDNILDRHGLKSFSTPYSHGRSNIDYALSLEKNNYNGLLNKENLKYEFIDKERVVRSTLINQCDKIFFEPHMDNFEFTHHDVINEEKARNNLKRKIYRLLKFRGKKDITFFYHYRISNNTNFDLLFKKAIEFANVYSINKHSCNIIVFSQSIINHKSERKLCYRMIKPNVHFFEFNTEQIWTGANPDVFWAKVDDDLINIMIIISIQIVKNKLLIPDGEIYQAN